jgi:hypothetical protein
MFKEKNSNHEGHKIAANCVETAAPGCQVEVQLDSFFVDYIAELRTAEGGGPHVIISNPEGRSERDC